MSAHHQTTVDDSILHYCNGTRITFWVASWSIYKHNVSCEKSLGLNDSSYVACRILVNMIADDADMSDFDDSILGLGRWSLE